MVFLMAHPMQHIVQWTCNPCCPCRTISLTLGLKSCDVVCTSKNGFITFMRDWTNSLGYRQFLLAKMITIWLSRTSKWYAHHCKVQNKMNKMMKTRENYCEKQLQYAGWHTSQASYACQEAAKNARKMLRKELPRGRPNQWVDLASLKDPQL